MALGAHEILSSKQGFFLKAAVHSAAPPGCRGAHDVWGARFLLAATNVNQSSLQLYVTMPIRVI
jgi:hypothetical protein